MPRVQNAETKMKMKSFLTCPHKNMQAFTEVCLDCGWNIYTSQQDYLASLQARVAQQEDQQTEQVRVEEIRRLEDKLGVKR